MPHARLPGVEVIAPDRLAHGEVCPYGPLDFSLVRGEQWHQVGLEMALGILEVAGQQPVDRPVAAAHTSERVHRRERVSLVGCDPTFDDDEHRPVSGATAPAT